MPADTSKQEFVQYIASLRPQLKRLYDRSVNRDLSRQQSQGVLQRNMVAVLQQVYDDSLKQLRIQTASSTSSGPDLAEVLQAFDGMIDELLQYAVQNARSSCAMSNFPEEHNPSPEYIASVLENTRRDWDTFSAQLEQLLAAA